MKNKVKRNQLQVLYAGGHLGWDEPPLIHDDESESLQHPLQRDLAKDDEENADKRLTQRKPDQNDEPEVLLPLNLNK